MSDVDPAFPLREAHIVRPAIKMQEVLDGTKQKVKALCGKWVTKDFSKDYIPVCRGCFDELMKLEQKAVNDIAVEAQAKAPV